MTIRARARKRPLPSSPASSGELAALILQEALERADYVGRTRNARSHFLLIELSNDLFLQLCHAGAEQEDAEDSDGLQHDDCDDEDNGDHEPDDGTEPDTRHLPRPHEGGRWVIFPKGRHP